MGLFFKRHLTVTQPSVDYVINGLWAVKKYGQP